MNQSATCSQIAADLAEPIHGTASKNVRYWILLEDRSRWGRNAFETAPELTRQTVDTWTSELEGSKAIGIRRKGRTDRDHVLFFADAQTGQIWRWISEDPAELLKLNSRTLLSGAGATSVHHSLFLVCTHGKRDQCCALKGAPVFLALLDALDESRAWQATHLGGHRFAPNVLALPSGILYGRLNAHHVADLIQAEDDKQILSMRTFRGFCHLPRPVQYADAWLRTQLKTLGIDSLNMVRHSRDGDRWTVEFDYDGSPHRVVVLQRKKASRPQVLSCGEPPSSVDVHEVLEHRTESGL